MEELKERQGTSSKIKVTLTPETLSPADLVAYIRQQVCDEIAIHHIPAAHALYVGSHMVRIVLNPITRRPNGTYDILVSWRRDLFKYRELLTSVGLEKMAQYLGSYYGPQLLRNQ